MHQFGIVEPKQGLERMLPSLFQKGKKKLVIDIGLPFFQFTNGFTFSKLPSYLSGMYPLSMIRPIHPAALSASTFSVSIYNDIQSISYIIIQDYPIRFSC
jgi:hypothetical protein